MNANHEMTVRLDDLRSQLTDDQRAILNAIWGYYREHISDKQSIPVRLLHHSFGRSGKATVRAALKELSGSIAVERGYGPDARYGLTFLGVLLTDQGEEAANLLVRYLDYVRERFSSDPLITHVKSADVALALGLTKEQSGLLKELLDIGHFWGSSAQFGEEWHVGLPTDIEEMASVEDLRAYVQARALERFDLNLPFEENERASYSASKHRGQELPSPFLFINDPELQRQLTEDWQEAQNVYQVKAWKSCAILCGGILEGMLFDALIHNKESRASYQGKKKNPPALDRWDLAELVDTAREIGILGVSDFHLSQALREYRNLIHPGRQVREKVKVTEHEATIALSAVKIWLQVLALFHKSE